ncbi:hypothetical protein C8D77_101209 [Mesorhizobium loti]|uniref:Uncharacterized protein n=1 Tax=Rhizobium loti TaxID=381 RepID=A0A8E3B6U1_RHILI|nr:hypothetical protein [Mesorhizobium loti]PWJ93530.1 hypothetical protein C8D77_101209 [Mesorhizobium loti]
MMDNPGTFNLGDLTITTAQTLIGDAIIELDGMQSALLQLRLAYGSGGSTIRAYVQCSADQATTWYDVACVLFGTASEVALLNLSALTPKTTQVTPTDGALADDTAVDGLITDRMRLKVVSTGTYAGSTVLSARMVAR